VAHVHHYSATCTWSGSTAGGYESYDRTHRAAAPPAAVELMLTSDPAFRGDPALLNPEQLLVLAASSCQLLSFLTVAAKARLDVVEYRDAAEGFMPEDDPPVRVTQIVLRPHITVRGVVAEERLRHLCNVAHRECYIANSVRTDITLEPTFTVLND
jgi:organic hydroperoxide reductase OsmC/OhrA